MNGEWLARVVASALVRRLVYLAVAGVVAWLGMGQARAADLVEGSREYHASEGEAYAACMAQRTKAQGIKPTWSYFACVKSSPSPVWKNGIQYTGEWKCEAGFDSGSAKYTCNHSNVGFISSDRAYYWWRVGTSCPVDQPPQSDGTCAPPPPSDEECLALNAEPGFLNSGPRSRTYTSMCLDNGCMWELVDNATSAVVNGFTVHSGTFEFTGACTKTSTSPNAGEETPATSQTCAPASGGQTFCLKGNGEHCYTASTGKQICWTPGETGTKTTDNVAQKRVSGTNPPTPPTPPEGETFTQGPSTTATTDKDGVTITTTTTNFVTTGGTDAGEADAGEPDDGTGGDEDGDESGVSGGSCSAGYVCSGDAIQCAILEEAHNDRCAREGLATELAEGADDYGPEGVPGDAFGDGQNLAATVLDTAGWLGGGDTCPVDNLPELPGLDLVQAVCPGANVLAIYVYLLGLIHCAHILGRAASGGA